MSRFSRDIWLIEGMLFFTLMIYFLWNTKTGKNVRHLKIILTTKDIILILVFICYTIMNNPPFIQNILPSMSHKTRILLVISLYRIVLFLMSLFVYIENIFYFIYNDILINEKRILMFNKPIFIAFYCVPVFFALMIFFIPETARDFMLLFSFVYLQLLSIYTLYALLRKESLKRYSQKNSLFIVFHGFNWFFTLGSLVLIGYYGFITESFILKFFMQLFIVLQILCQIIHINQIKGLSILSSDERNKCASEEEKCIAEEDKSLVEGLKNIAGEEKYTTEKGKTTAEEEKCTVEEGRTTVEGLKCTVEEGRTTVEGLKCTVEEGKEEC